MGKVEGLAALAFGLCVGEEGRRSPGLVSDGANPFCSPASWSVCRGPAGGGLVRCPALIQSLAWCCCA